MIRFKHLLLLISLLLPALPATVMSELPQAVDNQELPSLAPMVERTRPAVVNIATRGRVDVQNHPLLNEESGHEKSLMNGWIHLIFRL